MRLLLVGLPPSVHLVKAVALLQGLGCDIHVVGSVDQPWHPGFDGCTVHHLSRLHPPPASTPTRTVVVHQPSPTLTDVRGDHAAALARLIDELRPDIVHSHEFQHAAYTTLLAREVCREPFPTWVVSCWGSDLYFYLRDPQHRAAIEAVLALADGFGAECSRDVALARASGFRGVALPIAPIAGGYDLRSALALRVPGPTSQRTAVAVKGYQHRFGRALTALDALDTCGDLLAGREVVLYAASHPDVAARAAQVAAVHDAQLTVLGDVPNDEIIRTMGRARVSVGVSISDGASTCFLEALLGGAFPVQSFTACATEWVVDGTSALLVDPTNLASVGAAIRRALADDALVDNARAINDHTVATRLDAQHVRAATVAGYRQVLDRRLLDRRPTASASVT